MNFEVSCIFRAPENEGGFPVMAGVCSSMGGVSWWSGWRGGLDKSALAIARRELRETKTSIPDRNCSSGLRGCDNVHQVPPPKHPSLNL